MRRTRKNPVEVIIKGGECHINSAAFNVEGLLRNLGHYFDFNTLNDDNFKETPKRVVKAYREILSGYTEDPRKILESNFPVDDYDQMIVVKDIDFYSVCAHHMLPFFGKIAVGYIPSKRGRVVGLSKLARVCQTFAKRFQIQERLVRQICDAINESLEPVGAGVVAYDVKHLCMLMRGVKQHTSTMTTSCLVGEFKEIQSVKSEFLRLAGI